MNSSHVKSFLETARAQSFTRAAARLHQTQPGISRHIASLEQELETRLFVREPHKQPVLTETGKIYYEAFAQCERILQEARIQSNKISRDRKLHLRFGYAFGWSTSYFLPDMLETMKLHFPSLNIELECHGPNTLYSLLESDDLDLVLTIKSPFPNDSPLSETVVCELPRVILYSDNLVKAHGEIRRPEDIGEIPILLPVDEVHGKFTEAVRGYLKDYNFKPVFRTVSNQNTAISVVETGDGVMIHDAWAQHLFIPQYHCLPIGSSHTIALVCRKDCEKDKVITAIRNALKKSLGSPGRKNAVSG